MFGYYSEKLAGERLMKCYELAPRATLAYMEAEIRFVLDRVAPSSIVLDLGCGDGRVLGRLAERARLAVGIDSSVSSVMMGRDLHRGSGSIRLLAMDAGSLGFADGTFDLVICIQNGISAFHVDPHVLLGEALRVTRPGGKALFSSYSARFWEDRLEWFRIQSEHGLVGEIDWEATGNGVIVCNDGFRATTFGPDDFRKLTDSLGVEAMIEEVDESSLFCEITIPAVPHEA